ncbi:MAG: LuxR C-terminal-related transcriptional regulator [Bdellovibrionota bacterium]
MKPLAIDDLAHPHALTFFELGYVAGNCKNPKEFQQVLKAVHDVFPTESIVCGLGEMADGIAFSGIWKTPELAPFKVARIVTDANYPSEFLNFYINADVLKRDCHFYECLRTQKALIWSDLYQRYKHPFDSNTKCGFDGDFVSMLFDHNLHNVLRCAPVDMGLRVTNLSLTFRNRKEAWQFSGLVEAVAPYIHQALLRVYGPSKDKFSQSVPVGLSLREREILKWLIEGKGNWEIGHILHISERTVKFHVQQLMRKLGAMNRSQLVANACQQQEFNSQL